LRSRRYSSAVMYSRAVVHEESSVDPAQAALPGSVAETSPIPNPMYFESFTMD
jgi:hypothetical protein